jgi:CRISPR/Cas system-associated exonuclease Cas4 (RecB family)
MNHFASAIDAYPVHEGNINNRGAAETNHVLSMLEIKSYGGKRFRPFAGSVAYCPRENWLHANTGKEGGVASATMSLYQGVGNGVEERIVKGALEHGKLLGTQVKLPNPPKTFGIDVGGYIDMIAYDSLGRVAAYEIKTTGAMPSSPKAKHLAQAMTYSVLGGLDIVYIIYVGRKVQDFPDPTPLVKVFQVDVGNLLREYGTTILLTTSALSSPDAPPRPATFRKSSECSYCDFQQKCWRDEGFDTMNARKSAEHVASAEKTVDELLLHRPSFFVNTLEACTPSCPVGNQDALKEEIEKARNVNVKAKRSSGR